MTEGLPVAYASPFGDPESLPIMSARDGQIVRVADADPDGDRWEFVMPANTLAFELSIINDTDATGRVTYLAGEDLDSVADGIVRLVPVGGQIVEFRHATEGDKLIIEVADERELEVIVHAHLGGAS